MRLSPARPPGVRSGRPSIKPSGEVTSVTTTGDSPTPVNACIQAAIKAWKFPGGAQAYTVKRVLAYKPR